MHPDAIAREKGQSAPASDAPSAPPAGQTPLEVDWSPDRIAAPAPERRVRRLRPVLLTLLALVVATISGRAMWSVYMEGPWTRDGTVRVYVATIAPEVSGRIMTLEVSDNQFVRRGDLLMQIDPTDYRNAVHAARAALLQAKADASNIDAEVRVQAEQIKAKAAQVLGSEAALMFARKQAARYETLSHTAAGTIENAQHYETQLRQQEATLASDEAALVQERRRMDVLEAQRLGAEASIAHAEAQLDQASVNLARTEIRATANGWITNLLIHEGDYAATGRNIISVIDADTFWVDGYFEETSLAGLHVHDPAKVKLMGYKPVLRGHVESMARAIKVSNAVPDEQGLADVNPIFTWVRLAQRIPVRVHIDSVPAGVVLAAGMTATIEVDRPDTSRK